MSSLRNSYTHISNPRGRYATRDMTIDGVQGSETNMNVNGATTPVKFWYQPQPNDLFRVDVIHVSIADGGDPGYDDYGNVTGPLDNGTRFFIERDGVEFFSTRLYKTNVDWVTVATSSEIYPMATNTRIIVYRAQYSQFASGELFSGLTNDKIGIEIQDDLTGLQVHNCTLTGAVFRAAV